MIVVIAEKPSVAHDIANILGANQKEEGYYSGNGYTVTWAYGHLISLATPGAYGFEGFKKENLPILPPKFQLTIRQIREGRTYKNDPGASKQLNVLKKLFNKCDSIIVATDAGREGELIFRYIYNYLDCHIPFKRLWISSLTDKAISEGFNNLKPGELYDKLYLSAKARSEADWRVGINASQALSIAAGSGVFSLGRVQTPTLAMICNRYYENRNFKSQKYWEIRVQTGKDENPFSVMYTERLFFIEKTEELISRIKNSGSLIVTNVEKKETIQDAPLLYDLTTLQKDANVRLNFSADKTLSIAQTLYEKKLISYPRTGSRYISADVFAEIPERIAHLKGYPKFSVYASGMIGKTLNSHSVNDSKVTDHHALIITENLPKDLNTDDKAVYELIAGRMLEAFSDKCVKDVTIVLLHCGSLPFVTKGSVVKQFGWKAVFNIPEEKDESECPFLPFLEAGDMLCPEKIECLEKQTKPKPLHTEASLLATMEACGKNLEKEELKDAIKDIGIGTPATRAAIIETLFTREYIIREKKALVPTEKGLSVYDIVKDKKISDIEMTGQWENSLAKIESGELQPEKFDKDIELYTRQITNELLKISIENIASNNRISLKCPKCGKNVIFYKKAVKCENAECGLTVFREICKKTLTTAQIEALFQNGETDKIQGFVSKVGKKFPAILKFVNWEVKFKY